MNILKLIIYILFAISGFFTFIGVARYIGVPNICSKIGTSTNIEVLSTSPLFIGVSLYGFFILKSPSIGVTSLIIGFMVLLIYSVAFRGVLASFVGRFGAFASRRDK